MVISIACHIFGIGTNTISTHMRLRSIPKNRQRQKLLYQKIKISTVLAIAFYILEIKTVDFCFVTVKSHKRFIACEPTAQSEQYSFLRFIENCYICTIIYQEKYQVEKKRQVQKGASTQTYKKGRGPKKVKYIV